MKHICSWCGKLTKETSNPSEDISHGICKECVKAEFKGLTDEEDVSDAHPSDLPPKE